MSWILAEKCAKLALTLFVTSQLARHLGPEGLGRLSHALSFCALFGFLVMQGIDQLIVKELLTRDNESKRILSGVFLLRLCGAALAIISCLLVANVTGLLSSPSGGIITIIILGYAFNSLDFSDHWFQSQYQNKWSAIARTTAFVIASLVRLYLIRINAPLIAFAIAQVLDTAGASLAIFCIYKIRKCPELNLDGALTESRYLGRKGLPLFISSLAVLTYARADQILMGHLGLLTENGHYSAAYKIIEYVYVLPMIFATAVYPLIVKVYASTANTSDKNALNVLLFSLQTFALAITSFILLAAQPVVQLLYGSAFEHSVKLLQIISLVIPAVFFSVVRQAWFTSTGKLIDALKFECIALCFSLGLNIVLIPQYGALGSALALLITAYGSNLVGAILLRPVRESFVVYAQSITGALLLLKNRRTP